jgi:hypothetical protein
VCSPGLGAGDASFDHLGAEIGEVHAEKVGGEERELEHAYPAQQRVHGVVTGP